LKTMAVILIVEDNVHFSRTVTDSIQGAFPQAQVIAAGDGESALERAQKRAPDVAIVDIALPGMDGLEFTEKLVAEDPRVRVIILTHHDSLEYRKSAEERGASHFLSKGETSLREIKAVVASEMKEQRG